MSATHNFVDWRVEDPRGGVPTDQVPQVEEVWYTREPGGHWDFYATFYTPEEAEAFVALFPKYAKVRTGTLGTSYGSSFDDDADEYRDITLYSVWSQGTMKADKVNGGINETGDKRRAAIKKVLEGLS